MEEERRERRKEERRGRKEEEEDKEKNRECDAKDALPPPKAFPSQELGNNMTPIKGRLGKNTTPTHGDSEKLVQRRQRSPNKDNRTSSIHPMRTSSTHCEKQKSPKAWDTEATEPSFIRRSKHSGICVIVQNSP